MSKAQDALDALTGWSAYIGLRSGYYISDGQRFARYVREAPHGAYQFQYFFDIDGDFTLTHKQVPVPRWFNGHPTKEQQS